MSSSKHFHLQNIDLAKAEKAMAEFLTNMGFDWSKDPNMQNTPERVTRMYSDELFAGLTNELPRLTTFELDDSSTTEKQNIVVGPISIKSQCSHHMMPVVGECFIGVLVSMANLPGLSKYARLVHHFSRRPTLQETLGNEIADSIIEQLHIEDVAVVIRAKHFCMTHRGVNENESVMTTSVMRGAYKTGASLRSEFLSLIQNQ